MCVLALLLCSTTAHAQGAKKRDISGAVLDVDARPVANATVTVTGGGPTATTAADGSFKLAGVATTNVMLEITADGFTAKQIPVLGATTALQLSVVIVKPAAPPPPPPVETRMIGGVVSDPAHAPLAGAKVRVHGTSIETVTGADGTFTLPGVAVAEVVLDVEAPNQPPATVTLPPDKAAVAITVGVAAETPALPATRAIRGKVIDPSTKEPIVAAQVQVVGTQILAITEADGTYVVEGVALGPVQLDVTGPDRETQVVDVPAGKDAVDIRLGLAEGEVVVVEGRAPSITKGNITGGGSVIDGKDLTRVAASTLDDAMTGKLAGANLQANSGAPGGGAQLRLRGISTINGQSTPLYVIDGVIISNISTASGVNAVTAAANNGGQPSNQDNPVNRVADLNPNDIENVEVLKGASAAALYGSKAANGVVIITTKRGRQGENHASVTQRFGLAQPTKVYGSRHFTSVDDVKAAFGDTSPLVQAYIDSNGQTWDHEREIMRSPFLMETLANVTGGTEAGNYYGSVLVSDQPAIVIGTFYKKQTGRLAVGYKFGDHVKLSLTANLLHSLSDRGLSNNDNTGISMYSALSATPTFVDLRPKDGVYPANVAITSNPLQNVAEFQNREELTRLISGASATVDVYSSADNVHRVKLLGNLGIDAFSQKNNITSPSDLTWEGDDGLVGTVVDGTTTNTNMNVGASGTWSYTPKTGGFRSGLTAGFTYESVDTATVQTVAKNLTAGQEKIDSATSINTFENLLRTKEVGGYVQEELSLMDDRLSVLGGLLSERSSLNGDPDKFFFYPKLGGAYSLIKPAKAGEPRLFDAFESMRVRAAYGETGNRPNYGNKFTALSAVNNIGVNAGLIVNGTAGDPTIQPERQREFEAGVDLATKDQRVVAELTGYQRNISNMLLQQALATSTGFGVKFTNGGGLRNRGIEAAVAVKPVVNKMLDWTTRATLTLNRSQITDLPSTIPPFNTGNSFGQFGSYRIEVGKSATQIVAPVNGMQVAVGDGEPDFRIGWSNVINAGDFTISTLVDWQQGSNIMNLTRNYYDGNGTAPDPEAAAARLEKFKTDSRAYIEDGSFVKIREISVAYSLPKRLATQLGPLKSLQLSLSGRNLMTFTHYTGLDPEVSNFGPQAISRNVDVTPYPPSRTYWFSITAGI